MLGEGAGVGTELLEGLNDVVGEQVLKTAELGVLCHAVYYQESVVNAVSAHGVTVPNVEADFAEVTLGVLEDLATFALIYQGPGCL